MVGQLSRPIAVLAMASALLTATPLAASATAPPAADLGPTAVCSTAPPPLGYGYVGSYQSCSQCQIAAFELEQEGRRAYCYLAVGSGRVDLYTAPRP